MALSPGLYALLVKFLDLSEIFGLLLCQKDVGVGAIRRGLQSLFR